MCCCDNRIFQKKKPEETVRNQSSSGSKKSERQVGFATDITSSIGPNGSSNKVSHLGMPEKLGMIGVRSNAGSYILRLGDTTWRIPAEGFRLE